MVEVMVILQYETINIIVQDNLLFRFDIIRRWEGNAFQLKSGVSIYFHGVIMANKYQDDQKTM